MLRTRHKYASGDKVAYGTQVATYIERKSPRKHLIRDGYGFQVEVLSREIKPL